MENVLGIHVGLRPLFRAAKSETFVERLRLQWIDKLRGAGVDASTELYKESGTLAHC